MNADFARIAASIFRQSQEIQASINSPNATLESIQDPGNAEEAKALPVVKEVWAVHSLPPKFLIDGTVEWDVTVMMILSDEPSIRLWTSIKESEGFSSELLHESYFKALIGACNKPGGITRSMLPDRFKRPRRPSKILFLAKASELALKKKVKTELGIPCALASTALSQKIISALVEEVGFRRVGSSLNPMEPITREALGRHLQSSTQELPEDPEPGFSASQLDESFNNATPRHWYIRSPPLYGQYKERDLFGWRSNLENAVRRGDCDRTTQICAMRPPDDVSEYVNMRLLLRKMAETGQLDICKVLFTCAGANLDCVHSPNNKQEWAAYQLEAGNSRDGFQNFPLIEAAYNSHVHVVEWLIKQGATLNLQNGKRRTALHYAVSFGSKDIVLLLLKNGAKSDLVDDNGFTAIDVARGCAADDAGSRTRRVIVEMLTPDADGNIAGLTWPTTNCATCETPSSKLRCPCGRVTYCSKECQKSDWTSHKRLHK